MAMRQEDAMLFKTTNLKGAVWEDDSVEKKAKTGMAYQSKLRNMRREWADAADGFGGTVRAVGMRSVRIPDQVTWTKWKLDPSSMPDYLLQFISTNKGEESDEMKLYSPPVRYFAGENFIVEDIDKMGAIFLTTKEGQSDLAFSVKGKHVIGFAESNDYVLEDVAPHDNTQYVKDFARDHLKTELYLHTPPGSGKSIGEMVHYESQLKSATLFSYKIAQMQSGVGGAVLNWRAEDARGVKSIIYIGRGYQTTKGLGVVMEMSQEGVIMKWRELWDQLYFDSNYPCVIQAMNQHDVLETDVERDEPVPHKSILRVFEILPLALAQPHDMFGVGACFIVGIVRVKSAQPISIYGLEQVTGEDLLQCLHDQVSLTPNMNLSAYLDPLRAAIEDGLQYIAEHRIEQSRKPASPINIVLVPGQICMAILHAFTLKSHRKVSYAYNQIAVEFKDDDWKAMEQIMKRNARKTVVPDSGVVVVGAPKFKWMLLPYSKLVLSLKYYKLESHGGSISHIDTSANGSREFRSRLSDREKCSRCLRKNCDCDE